MNDTPPTSTRKTRNPGEKEKKRRKKVEADENKLQFSLGLKASTSGNGKVNLSCFKNWVQYKTFLIPFPPQLINTHTQKSQSTTSFLSEYSRRQ